MSLSLAEKEELIEKTWKLEQTPVVPYVIEIGQPHFATTEFYHDDQAELDWNEAYIQERAKLDDFGIPNIKTNIGIGVMAAAFGCEFVVNDESDPWIKPLIGKENIADVYNLKKPDLTTNPIYQKSFQRLEFLQKKTEHHLRIVNVPSPLVTASLIWEYTSFIRGTLKNPKEVHAILEIVTEATIEFYQQQLNVVHHPLSMGHEIWHIPEEVGIRISDDTAAVLSPKLYREFGVPYNERIAKAFGGVVIHSCGELRHVLPVMMETSGLRGLDVTIPQISDWDVIKRAAIGRTAINFRYFYWDHTAQGVDAAEYTKKLLDAFGDRGVFFQTSEPTLDEALRLREKIHPLLT